jgi:hypothetical protein
MMITEAGAPHNASDTPDPEYIDPNLVLAYVRQQAAGRDPNLGHIYATASAARVKEATFLAQRLLSAHRALLGRQGRGARTGRRKHAQEVYRLLNATNDATLALAISYLCTALGVLPRSWTRPGD